MLKKYEIISTYIIFILGSILHFTYELSNNNIIVSLFSSTNESTFEHLKILFYPMLLNTIIGFVIFKNEYPYYLCNKVKGIIISLLFIIIFFYTYTGILGKNIPLIDISSFFIAGALGQYYSYKNIKKECNNILSIILIIILILSFSIFTFNPPTIGLFKDPLITK